VAGGGARGFEASKAKLWEFSWWFVQAFAHALLFAGREKSMLLRQS